MASLSKQQLLVPDETLLSRIFPGAVDIKPTDCRVISNTFDKCTFWIQLAAAPPGYPVKDFLVRLETCGNRLAASLPLRRLAHAQLPDIVPALLRVGGAVTGSRKYLEYSVTAFCTGTTTLEDVWDTLQTSNQADLVGAVVQAMEKIQRLDPNMRPNSAEPPVKQGSLGCAPGAPAGSIGGPEAGYFPDIRRFLRGVLQADSPKTRTCELLVTRDSGVAIKSAFGDLGQVEFTCEDLDTLQRHVVFCHNDLEPRNILVRKTAGPDSGSGSDSDSDGPRYELAAIIDWEMAGFYPFAYEYGLKDCQLGRENLSFSWYGLFKERTAHLLPGGECHDKLMRALRIIDASKKRVMTRNVGVRFQQRWVARSGVERSLDGRRGWVRKAGLESRRDLNKEEMSLLELEVLEELGIHDFIPASYLPEEEELSHSRWMPKIGLE